MTDLDEPDSILPPSARPTPATPDRPPRAWVAVLLSLLLPGLGHAVRGRWQRALGWYSAVVLVDLFLSLRSSLMGTGALFIVARIVVAIDARRTPPTAPPPSTKRAWALALMLVAVGLTVRETIRRTIVEIYSVPSGSMIPTLQVGDHFYVDKLAYRQRAPERGDVIVFRYPKEPATQFVKRVIGVPGDTIAIVHDQIVLNGRPVPRQALDGDCGYDDKIDDGEWTRRGCIAYRESLGGHDYRAVYNRGDDRSPSTETTTVPPDSYYVLGDNRDNSHDSRFWGCVPRALVVGRVETIVYSEGPRGPEWDRVQLRVR
jgi:signal peptidase I